MWDLNWLKGTLRNSRELILFKGSARRRKRRRKGGCDKVWKEKGKQQQQQHQKHRSALRALKKDVAKSSLRYKARP